MTYQQKQDQLIQIVIEKWNVVEENDRELTAQNGFADIDLKEKYDKAYAEWQQASNDSNNFLLFFKNSGKLPSDEF